jgi:Amino acid permease
LTYVRWRAYVGRANVGQGFNRRGNGSDFGGACGCHGRRRAAREPGLLAFSYARDGALPASNWVAKVHPRFLTPVNALVSGAFVTVLFVLLVFLSPNHNIHIWFITYPANTNVLVSLVSFAVSGIYLSFLLTVLASIIARARGWVPEGAFSAGAGRCRSSRRRTSGSCS